MIRSVAWDSGPAPEARRSMVARSAFQPEQRGEQLVSPSVRPLDLDDAVGLQDLAQGRGRRCAVRRTRRQRRSDAPRARTIPQQHSPGRTPCLVDVGVDPGLGPAAAAVLLAGARGHHDDREPRPAPRSSPSASGARSRPSQASRCRSGRPHQKVLLKLLERLAAWRPVSEDRAAGRGARQDRALQLAHNEAAVHERRRAPRCDRDHVERPRATARPASVAGSSSNGTRCCGRRRSAPIEPVVPERVAATWFPARRAAAARGAPAIPSRSPRGASTRAASARIQRGVVHRRPRGQRRVAGIPSASGENGQGSIHWPRRVDRSAATTTCSTVR